MENIKIQADILGNTSKKKVVTRFCPSPTGALHIGGIRTALYNYLFAKKHGGTFYIRIEDTDTKRFVEDAEEYIKNSLEWFGIIPDAAPWMEQGGPKYRQSARDYSEHIKKLFELGLAYYAFDTPEYIQNAKDRYPTGKGNTDFIYNSKYRMEMRNSLTMNVNEIREMLAGPYVIRFKTPPDKEFIVNDIIRGPVKFNTNQMDDKILVKANGIPTYHLANVCDDHDMGTSHVIRGEEWLPSAGLHQLFYEGMGWDVPEFAHVPLILNPNGKGKLSKRSAIKLGIPVFPMDAAIIEDDGTIIGSNGFKSLGYNPDALLNFLILLGWTPDRGREMLSLEDMIELFELSDVHHGSAKFDIEKAKFFNQYYIGNVISNEVLLKSVEIPEHYTKEESIKILNMAKARSILLTDLQKIVSIFINDIKIPITTGSNAIVWTTEMALLFDILKLSYNVHYLDWKKEKITEILHNVSLVHGVKENFIKPELRKLVGKGIPGPDIIDTMEILGRNESIHRMSIGLYK